VSPRYDRGKQAVQDSMGLSCPGGKIYMLVLVTCGRMLDEAVHVFYNIELMFI
jgi:hypothetical protein